MSGSWGGAVWGETPLWGPPSVVVGLRLPTTAEGLPDPSMPRCPHHEVGPSPRRAGRTRRSAPAQWARGQRRRSLASRGLTHKRDKETDQPPWLPQGREDCHCENGEPGPAGRVGHLHKGRIPFPRPTCRLNTPYSLGVGSPMWVSLD